MATQMKEFIKGFDLFNRPFEFFVGEKKSKSTFVGGFLSISIFAVSLAYLYYLLNMYFDNKFEPKITSSMTLDDNLISLEVTDSFVILELMIDDVPLNQYEKKVGKTFFSFSLEYTVNDPINGISSSLHLPLVKCTNSQFSNYRCIDSDSIEKFSISINALTNMSSQFTLYIDYCNNLIDSNCSTKQETMDLVMQPDNYFLFYTKIRQYSPDQRKYVEGYKQEYIKFESNLIIYTRISLIKAQTTVIDGLIIQSSTSSDDIFDYKRVDAYFTRDYSEKVMNFYGFELVVFENNQQRNIITIQHPMITEVLAQFMGIFNPLLIIGILAKMLADSQIIEDINNILLKEYYKLTALKLINHRENKLHLIDENHCQTDLNQSQAIVQLANKLRESDFAEQKIEYFQMSFLKRAKLFFGKLVGQQPDLSQQKKGSDSRVYHQVLQQTMKRINIFEVYKDIIQLKMFIKLMLSKEQFAAMQFCGSEIPEDEDIEARKRLRKQSVMNKMKSKIKLKEKTQSAFRDTVTSMIQKNNVDQISNPLNLELKAMNIEQSQVKIFENEPILNKLGARKEPQKQEISQFKQEQEDKTHFQQGKSAQQLGDKQIKSEEIETEKDSTIEEKNKNIMKVKEMVYTGQLESEEEKQSHFKSLEKGGRNTLSSQSDYEEKEKVKREQQNSENIRNSYTVSNHKILLEGSKSLKDEGDEIEMGMDINISSQTEDEKQKKENEQQLQVQNTIDKLQQYQEEAFPPRIQNMEIINHIQNPLPSTKRRPYIKSLINQRLESRSPNKDSLFESGLQYGISNYRSHLCEMDQIEFDQDVQEKLLQTFLQDFHNKLLKADNKVQNLSCIDRNIYQSLLVKDKNVFSDYQ